jgi:FkbM family methyltransferase
VETPLLHRGIHFLRKAGFRKFALKTVLWGRALFYKRYLSYRDQKLDCELARRLATLPQIDGHVAIPVLDFVMKVHAGDPGLSRELILHGVRERDAVQFLKPHLSRCATIIEIGANQGYYLIQEARYSPPNAMIHAFEPHPDNVRTAALNIALNDVAHKCRLEQAAISDKRGKSHLIVSNRSNWHTLTPLIENDVHATGGTMDVETRALDEYTAAANIKQVDLIRMDVEGHEYAVIRGAVETIKRSPNVLIFLEFHTSLLRQAGESPEDFLKLLQSLGLKCLVVCGYGRHLVEPGWGELIRDLELIITRYGTHMFFMKDGSTGNDHAEQTAILSQHRDWQSIATPAT